MFVLFLVYSLLSIAVVLLLTDVVPLLLEATFVAAASVATALVETALASVLLLTGELMAFDLDIVL